MDTTNDLAARTANVGDGTANVDDGNAKIGGGTVVAEAEQFVDTGTMI